MTAWIKYILLVGVVLIGLYGLFQIGYYSTSSPQFCTNCHEVAEYTSSWEVSAHNKIGCLECHEPGGEFGKIYSKAKGLNYVFKHLSEDYTIPTKAKVFEQNCLQCHLGDNEDYPDTVQLKNTSLINHYKIITQSQSCLDCHRDTGHKVDINLTPDLRGIR